jgi:hypothetical protein
MFEGICARDLEGIVGKRRLGVYKDDGNEWLTPRMISLKEFAERHRLEEGPSSFDVLESTTLFKKPTCRPTGRWHLHTCADDLDLGGAAVDEEFDAVDET